MAAFMVIKRMVKGGEISLPNDVIELDQDNDPEVPILIQRGFLTPIPDNYRSASAGSRETPAPEPEQAPEGAASTSPTPPSPDGEGEGFLSLLADLSDEDATKELVGLNRADLNAVAVEVGIEEPDKLPNKDAVAAAIVAKRNEA